MIGVCDHNSAGNVRAVAAAAGRPPSRDSPAWRSRRARKRTWSGLFPSADAAEAAAREVAAGLPPCRGEAAQELVDADGATVEARAADAVDGLGVLAGGDGGPRAPARRRSRSRRTWTAGRSACPSQLGFIPPDAGFQALEISAHGARIGRAAVVRRTGVRAHHGLRRPRARAGGRRVRGARGRGGRTSASSPSRSPARTAGGARLRELSLHVLDLVENSLRAGAGVVAVGVEEQPDRDLLAISVEDDGPGLAVLPEQALDPFYTTKEGKRTGLGLSLFRQQVEHGRGRRGARPVGARRASRCARASGSATWTGTRSATWPAPWRAWRRRTRASSSGPGSRTAGGS